jgi:hypothetical protein
MAAKKKLRVPFATVTRIPKEPPPNKAEHGIEFACYTNDGCGYKPLIVCLCGWDSGGDGECVSWAEAGCAFDGHLEGVP